LASVLAAAANGDLGDGRLGERRDAAVTVVVAADGYPDRSAGGIDLGGLGAARETGALIFHAGTEEVNGRVVGSGGRVLGVTGVGASLAGAREQAYAAARLVTAPGLRHRSDIALEAAGERVGVA
jgi:phosphoribosylamine--glycine ligase